MLVYVAGPYRPLSDRTTKENIAIAGFIASELWRKGHAVICPHMNCAEMEELIDDHDLFIRGDLMMIARCDAIVMLSRWQESKGATTEFEYAQALGIPIYYADDELPSLHPTEVRCPSQCKAFAETLGEMYRLHLSKNQDYSPANVLGTAEIGVTVRLWDKLARLMNLMGIQVEISDSKFLGFQMTPEKTNLLSLWDSITKILKIKGFRFKAIARLSQPKQPKHEAIEDAYIDAANYSIIGLLLRRGLWGR